MSATSPSTSTLTVRLQRTYERMGVGFAVINFVLLFILLTLTAPNFLSPLALSNILTFASFAGLTLVGVTLLMIAGEFDLSVGSTLADRKMEIQHD